jgi:hypothetical protein
MPQVNLKGLVPEMAHRLVLETSRRLLPDFSEISETIAPIGGHAGLEALAAKLVAG